MAVDITDFYELVNDTGSASTAGCSLQGGKSVMTLGLDVEELSDIQDGIDLLIGGTSVAIGDGRLSRTLPLANPMFPYQYVSTINTIRGIGSYQLVEADPDLETTTLPKVALYETYLYTVEFTPRPYALLEDIDIDVITDGYYDADGNIHSYTYATEYYRYTVIDVMSKEEAITATQGMMVFRTQSGTQPGNGPNGNPPPAQFGAQPRIFMPNQILKILWMQVPYRYITSPNSWISTLVGTINQLKILDYLPGQLLFIGYTPKPYTPPVPDLVVNEFGAGTGYSTERLMDIELLFSLTSRVVTDAPVGLPNKNTVAAFQNAFPWFGLQAGQKGRKFYFGSLAGHDNDPSFWAPVFSSMPHSVLFTDPDA